MWRSIPLPHKFQPFVGALVPSPLCLLEDNTPAGLPSSSASSVSPSPLDHSLEHKIHLNSTYFFKKENFPLTLCPIWLLPYPAASLYSRTRKNWLTLTFHSLFHYSKNLSSPPHPWKSSYQGPSATPNAMGISLSSCILTSYCILTQVFTFTFLNHFFLSALIVLPSIPIPTHFFFLLYPAANYRSPRNLQPSLLPDPSSYPSATHTTDFG